MRYIQHFFLALLVFIQTPSAHAGHLRCTGMLSVILSSGKKLVPPISSIISRKDSSVLKIEAPNGQKVAQIYPWFGIHAKSMINGNKTNLFELKKSGDTFFRAIVTTKKKLYELECDVVYE